ncbi:cytochrome P450 [Xylogone sp. PMI_703]|nr:cytochrome P450 [Xylogone sp. PMI_703]
MMLSSLISSVSLNSLPIIVGVLLLYYFVWIIYTRLFHPLRDIPGPFWASISRILIGVHVLRGDSERVQRGLHKKFGACCRVYDTDIPSFSGPFVRIAPNEVAISDPDAIRVIYSINSGFTKVALFPCHICDLTDFYIPFATKISPHGDHFAHIDEHLHAQRRRFVNGIYSMSTILESEAYINDCIDVFLAKMAKFAKKRQSIDLGEWIQWINTYQFGFMKDEHDYEGYIKALDTLLPGVALAGVLPSYIRGFHQLISLLVPSIREGVRDFDKIRAAGRYWVQDRMDKMQAKKVNRVDLLDKFFKIHAEKDGFDLGDIQNEACVALLAGSDTTAIAIRSILYYLMRNPKSYEKLVEEIDKAYSDGSLSGAHITYAEAMRLPYLTACCKEGLRMHPSVGFGLPRYVPEGGKQICGRFFPGGSRVTVNAAVVHYDEGVFVLDAAEFNPDRWLGDSAANMDRHMLHFGGGSRTCLGKNVHSLSYTFAHVSQIIQISLAEIHKTIPMLLRSYRIELAEPDKEWQTHNFWFNKQTGIRVFVTAR